jgi:hypothetical protein
MDHPGKSIRHAELSIQAGASALLSLIVKQLSF